MCGRCFFFQASGGPYLASTKSTSNRFSYGQQKLKAGVEFTIPYRRAVCNYQNNLYSFFEGAAIYIYIEIYIYTYYMYKTRHKRSMAFLPPQICSPKERTKFIQHVALTKATPINHGSTPRDEVPHSATPRSQGLPLRSL